ncbi:VOC family protein [Longimicrobium sp.]|uniref:VOC family protein n=1 Tax=Longimicrobium sp. TaxID=2029185 RepID=UPI002E328873|nr:VOC family protein [Longimicrobium sp.]HEX6042530.1 VOC family protein [Longimicrobium sp.]
MSVPYKPAGYTDAAPYLIVDGAARTIDFLVQVFGAERLRRFDDPEGGVRHAEVRVGDTVVMLADGGEGYPPQPAHVHVYVPDVDDAYRRALEAGGESVRPPERGDDPDRRGGVRDPGGTTWWISTQME